MISSPRLRPWGSISHPPMISTGSSKQPRARDHWETAFLRCTSIGTTSSLRRTTLPWKRSTARSNSCADLFSAFLSGRPMPIAHRMECYPEVWMPLSPEELRPRLRGVLAFPVTPFNQDFSLNEDAFQSHVDYLIRAGMHAIVAAGGTGELYSKIGR